jgi:hypothetical protein
MKTQIPASRDNTQSVEIDLERPLVIVGANGAGKSRLGAHIEGQHLRNPICHRISAQRALSFPEEISPRSLDKALLDLLYGGDQVKEHSRLHGRWSGNRTSGLLNDFQRLLMALFSEDYEISTKYRQAVLANGVPFAAPKTKLDHLKEIWQRVHPQRTLELGGGTVTASSPGGTPYKAAELSDGERVTFYLIGQVLSVPDGSIIVIDEPEIHVHSAIQATLWDEIEASRPDCGFVYITHDLKFAATRTRAQKLWLKGFDGVNWEWTWIPEDSDFPEELLIQLLGSRRPILFVEGERDSWDSILYSQAFPGFLVVPLGGCGRVISFTKAFNALSSLHHNRAAGVIDRDYRTDQEIDALAGDQVFASNVAEVENLLVLPAFVEAMADICGHPDPADVATRLESFVLAEFTRLKDNHAHAAVSARARKHLEQFSTASTDLAGLKADIGSHVAAFDPESAYSSIITEADALIATRDVPGILKVFNHKALLPQIGTLLGLKPKEYEDRVRHHVILRKNGLADTIARHLPTLP